MNRKEKLPQMSRAEPDDNDVTSCGIGRFRPSFLQPLSKVGVFVAVYSCSGLLTSTLVVYVNSQANMLEKTYGFSSKESGFLMACNDIGFLITTILAGYIANKVHIPRGLCVSTFLYGVCGILCALPYFIQDKSVYDLEKTNVENGTNFDSQSSGVPLCTHLNDSDVMGKNDCEIADGDVGGDVSQQFSIKKVAFALIAVGMIIQGIGKSPRYPFLTLYIDDSVDRRETGYYMGLITGAAIFGPALSYGLSAVFSKIYVTLESVAIGPRDPRWIGAWWLGFIAFGGASILLSLPMLCFPRQFKKLQRVSDLDGQEKKNRKKTLATEIRNFLKTSYRVLHNTPFMLLLLSTCIHFICIGGMLSFSPKYIVSQFTLPLWKANLILAIGNILAVSIGAVIGGIITRKIRMTPTVLIKLMIGLDAVHLAMNITGFFLGCKQPRLFGGTENRTRSDLYEIYEHGNSSSCVCNDKEYYPVCGEDGRSYFSPCHAGCLGQDAMVFYNCSIITGDTALAGLCDQDCTTLYPWIILTFFGNLTSAFKIMPNFMFTIRCVEDKDRAMAAAISSFVHSAVGWLPGPVIFGALIDNVCILWKYICSKRQSCLLYDVEQFRITMYSFATVSKTAAMFILVAIYLIVRNKEWKNIYVRKNSTQNFVT